MGKNVQIQTFEKIWLTTKEVAEYLGMSKDFVKDLRQNGLLPYCQVNHTCFYLKKDIDRLIERHRIY